jgi:hypothetical protein
MSKLFLLLILGIAYFGCVEPPIEARYSEDYPGRFRFAVANASLFYRGQSMMFALPGDVPNAIPVTDTNNRPLYADTLIVSDKYILAYPNVYTYAKERATLHTQLYANDYYVEGKTFALSGKHLIIARRKASYRGAGNYLDTVNRLDIHDLDNPEDSLPIGSIGLTFPRAIAVHNNVVYVGDGDHLTVLDISDPANPRKVTTKDIREVQYMTLRGNRLVISQVRGVLQFDISDPLNPKQLSSLQ